MRQLFIIAMMFFLLLSCSKEKERPAQPIASELSPFENLREKTAKNPNDAEAWYSLADLYERSGAYREEVNALRKVIALEPKRGYAYLKLGNAYSRLELYQDAIDSYEKAAALLPNNAVLFNNLGTAYGRIGKQREHVAALEKAIALRPRYATARYNLGAVRLKQGNRAGALRQYEELMKFDEGMAAALKKEIDAPGR